MQLKLHNEGWVYFVISCLITIIIIPFFKILGIFLLILSVYIFYFFRDPKRAICIDDVVVSPADGLVTFVGAAKKPLEDNSDKINYTKISIFLSIFDVHVNRMPVDAKIISINYIPGKFINATLNKSSNENERNIISMETKYKNTLVIVQIAGIIGPLAAGYIMQAYGPGHLLLVISVSLFISAICVLPIPNLSTKSTPTGSIWRNFKAGLEFVLHDNPIRTVMIVLLFTEGLGFACWSMFPVVARDVLHAGPVVLGFLSTFRSLGGIIGAITVSAYGDIKSKGWVLIGADIIFGVFLIFFAFSSNLVMSLALIMIVGAFGTTVSTISSTLAQTMAPEEMRGRVMGLHGFITSSFGLGSLVMGTLANFLGVSWAIAIGGASVSSNAIRSIPKAGVIGERSRSQ